MRIIAETNLSRDIKNSLEKEYTHARACRKPANPAIPLFIVDYEIRRRALVRKTKTDKLNRKYFILASRLRNDSSITSYMGPMDLGNDSIMPSRINPNTLKYLLRGRDVTSRKAYMRAANESFKKQMCRYKKDYNRRDLRTNKAWRTGLRPRGFIGSGKSREHHIMSFKRKGDNTKLKRTLEGWLSTSQGRIWSIKLWRNQSLLRKIKIKYYGEENSVDIRKDRVSYNRFKDYSDIELQLWDKRASKYSVDGGTNSNSYLSDHRNWLLEQHYYSKYKRDSELYEKN